MKEFASRNAESTMREAVLASLGTSKVEADVLIFAAGSNVPTISESEAGSTGVLRRGEQTKCVWCTWEVWISPAWVRLNQGRQSRVRVYGSSEVGSPHSSVETCESRRSEGGDKSAIGRGKTWKVLETWKTWKKS